MSTRHLLDTAWISRLSQWIMAVPTSPTRSALAEELAFRAILKEGTQADCAHTCLQLGSLWNETFVSDGGDDVMCADCGQVWGATETSEYYRQFGSR